MDLFLNPGKIIIPYTIKCIIVHLDLELSCNQGTQGTGAVSDTLSLKLHTVFTNFKTCA